MGLLDRLRGKGQPPPQEFVYLFTFKIASGQTQIPAPMTGAYVVAYSMGDTPTLAAERAWQELRKMGYVVEDVDAKGGQLALAEWDVHIAERWPEFADRFPRQQDLVAVLERENAVFSPFAGFE